jgi:hypothetical protein
MHAGVFYHLSMESVVERVDRGGVRRGRLTDGL